MTNYLCPKYVLNICSDAISRMYFFHMDTTQD